MYISNYQDRGHPAKIVSTSYDILLLFLTSNEQLSGARPKKHFPTMEACQSLLRLQLSPSEGSGPLSGQKNDLGVSIVMGVPQ